MGIGEASAVGLSPGQAVFARDHDACAGQRGAGSRGAVFMYHDDLGSTQRWLVDVSGRVVDARTFRKSYVGRRISA